jgi:predicted secreted protein
MLNKKKTFSLLIALMFCGACLWAGDTATYVDLVFSQDGRTFKFAQYGVQTGTLRSWADLYVVDVAQNNFVPGGKISYTHGSAIVAGQDGSGALHRLITRNTTLVDRYGINFLSQGQPLYISPENSTAPNTQESIEFRDFQRAAAYHATLIPTTEGSGANVKSSFSINLERTARDGSKKSYVVGSPRVQRSQVLSYRIHKIISAPGSDSVIFVIEMRKQNGSDIDIRYMIETLHL